MGIFGSEGVKTNKIKKENVFWPPSNKFAIQNIPIMQLHLIFNKTVNKNKLKVLDSVFFQQFRKL